jgi:hypothetical protein
MSIVMRLSTEADHERIRRLAELDSRRPPQGDVLLAEVNGRLLAAIGMDGSVVADPFERTAAVVRVLRAQVAGERKRPVRGGGWFARRFSRPAAAG